MKTIFFLSAAAPLALACASPGTHDCAAAFVSSSTVAASFCATFTKGVVTATTAVPTGLLAACSYKTARLSSACSCYVTATAAAATSTKAATTPAATSTKATTTSAATSTKASTSAVTSKKAATSTSTTAAQTSKATTLVTSTKKTTTSQATSSAAAVTKAADSSNACIVTAYSGVSSAVKSCTNIVFSDLSIPASSTLDLQSLQTGACVTFAGTTTFGTTPNDDFDPIVISGTDITVTGAEGHVIEGNGAAYWDGQGSNGGDAKPNHFIVVKKTRNSKITNLNIKNWPVHCFYINANYNLEVSGLTLDNSAGDAPNAKSGSLPAAHNSDGFDISSSDNVVLDNNWVHNQDDCVAVTSGSNIVVNNMYCYGGHGLSIGSVGGKSNNTVDGVVFSNSQVIDSENGCRIKSNSGTTGTIANVSYQNITMSGITKYGIDVQQDYLNGGPTGKPTNGVSISGISFIDVTGTTTGNSAYNYYILCGDGSCSDFSFDDVSITGGGEGGSCNFPASGCPS